MGRVAGTNGETTVRIVVVSGPHRVISAYPVP